MNLSERVAQSLDFTGLSQVEIAKITGLHQQNISDIVRGTVKNPKIETLIKIAEICNIDLKWLITGKGEMIKSEPVKLDVKDFTLIDILGNVPAGMPVYAAEEVREGTVPYMKKNISSNAFALKVYGDSMEPELEEDDIVVCVPKSLIELPGKGEIVAVRLHTETVIKCLHKHKKAVVLTPINPKCSPIIIKPEEIGSLAKVVCKIKKYK